MNSLTISVFGNQTLSEIIKELSLFSKYKIKFYEDFELCQKDALKFNQLVIFLLSEVNKTNYEKISKSNFPLIVVGKSFEKKSETPNVFFEQLNTPFNIFELKKKVVSAFAKHEFKKNSLINLNGYVIDKNERKIKKNNLELQLTEKEIVFLILFSKNNKPVSRDFVLKNVWNYSAESDTHTIETHIYRLRKKISEKFNDDNFIKNNNKGYYI